MAAQILTLAHTAERRALPPAAAVGIAIDDAARCQLWRGVSGRRYVHTVYSLIECPPVPKATYLLVRRKDNGSRQVLHIASGENSAPTLNLARIRQLGASLGANEVHVHFLAETESQRRLVTCDLRAGLFGSLSAEPARARC
ncbi:MAG TPA: hypothetical protein VJ233_14670 [Hyphomicrobiaceae bacterium]|nr:hypothetical protein [Hyphomicrobiaceae bacterium]